MLEESRAQPVEASNSNRILRWLLIIQSAGLLVLWPSYYLAGIQIPGWHSPEAQAFIMTTTAIDALIALTGIGTLILWHRNKQRWRIMAVVCMSLVLCGSVQTTAFAVLIQQADVSTWVFGLLFILYPAYFIRDLSRHKRHFITQGV